MNLFKPALSVLRSSLFILSKPILRKCQVAEQVYGRFLPSRCIHLSRPLSRPLDEFFDDPENYDLENIYVGRPWRKEELRLKSNEDLHKLWYVLLKERNMLMTMEQAAYDQIVPLAGPERIFKVEESMENLLEVVKERDIAYNILKHNKTGEPKTKVVRNFAGIPYRKTERANVKPRHFNRMNQLFNPEFRPWMYKYLAQYEQKLRKKYNYEKAMCKKRQIRLMKEFPHLTWEDVAHIKPNDRRLREFLKMSAELNDHDFKIRKVY